MKTSLYFAGAAGAWVAAAALWAAQDQPPPPPPPNPPPADNSAPPPPPPPVYSQPQEAPPPDTPPPAPPPPQAQPAPIGGVSLPPGLSRSQVQGAILAALQHREWTVVSTGDHSVVAHLLHHHVDATITLTFNRERVDIYSESYVVGHHAEDRIMPLTRSDWIRNLEHDIPYFAERGGGR